MSAKSKYQILKKIIMLEEFCICQIFIHRFQRCDKTSGLITSGKRTNLFFRTVPKKRR